MRTGVDKGIWIAPSAAAGLSQLGAAGAAGAWVLQGLLLDGSVTSSDDAFGLGVHVLWQPSDRGPVLVALTDDRVVAALVRPYDSVRLELRRRHGLPVDPRGPIEPPDDVDGWFDDNPERVDVYNTEVLAVRDLTAAWNWP